MKETKITCDQCEHDLTYTANCSDYYLVLGNASKGHYGNGAVTMMALSPPVDRTHHFCGLPCLAVWLKDKYPTLEANYQRIIERRQKMAELNKTTQ